MFVQAPAIRFLTGSLPKRGEVLAPPAHGVKALKLEGERVLASVLALHPLSRQF